jgi:hypothetical protein
MGLRATGAEQLLRQISRLRHVTKVQYLTLDLAMILARWPRDGWSLPAVSLNPQYVVTECGR